MSHVVSTSGNKPRCFPRCVPSPSFAQGTEMQCLLLKVALECNFQLSFSYILTGSKFILVRVNHASQWNGSGISTNCLYPNVFLIFECYDLGTLYLWVQNFVLTNPVCLLSPFEIIPWQQDTKSELDFICTSTNQ